MTKPDNEVNFCIYLDRYGNENKSCILINKNKRQIKKRDNCRISTQKDMTEEIRTKIKRKRPVCDSK